MDRTAGANAVLSGIFLGEGGSPPNPAVSSAPQGGWVDAVGSSGYDLAGWDGATGDVAYLPNASLNLVQGTRFHVGRRTRVTQAHCSTPAGLVRNAGTYYDPSQIKLTLSFPLGYTGNVHLYALDWDSTARRELVTVNGQSAVLSSSFHEGAWVTLPVNVPPGGTATITVDRTAGANAVLSGIFIGEAGHRLARPCRVSRRGSWVGVHGAGGYDLAGWNGASDLASLGSASVVLLQGARYVWAGESTETRALQAPSGPERKAATYFDPNEIQLQLTFPAGYSGSMELYAIDWDSTARREIITVGSQSVELSSDFSGGAWISLPVVVAAGETLSVTVNRLAGANAVLSGILLN